MVRLITDGFPEGAWLPGQVLRGDWFLGLPAYIQCFSGSDQSSRPAAPALHCCPARPVTFNHADPKQARPLVLRAASVQVHGRGPRVISDFPALPYSLLFLPS